MSQTLQMTLISLIAGVMAASVVYALWGVVATTIGRARARAAAAAPERNDENQSAGQPE